MRVTSAEANKMLKQLKEEEATLKTNAEKSATFSAAAGENIEELRPEFNYEEYMEKWLSLETRIRDLKHKINLFNSTTEVPGLKMTIDQVLIYIPFLTAVKREASEMMSRLPRERKDGRYSMSNVIDYTITNYPIEKAAETFKWASDELNKAQLALDEINTSKLFEI